MQRLNRPSPFTFLAMLFACVAVLSAVGFAHAAPIDVGDEVEIILHSSAGGPILAEILYEDDHKIRIRHIGNGKEETRYLREIKSMRILGAPIDRDGEKATPPPPRAPAKPEVRPAHAMLMKIESIPTNQADFAECWKLCSKANPETIGIWLNCGAIGWPTAKHLIGLMHSLPPATRTMVVVEKASDAAAMIVFHADRKVWMPDASLVGYAQAPPEDHASAIRSSMGSRLPKAVLDALLDGGTLGVNAQRLTATKADSPATIDVHLARMAGFEVSSEANNNGIRETLGDERVWDLGVKKVADVKRIRDRDATATARKVKAAQRNVAEAATLGSAIQTAAKEFDRFYRDIKNETSKTSSYSLKKVWLLEEEFHTRRQQQRSSKLQSAALKEAKKLSSTARKIELILRGIPDTDPAHAGLLSCFEGLESAAESLKAYISAIKRNNYQEYESNRARAMSLTINGC